METETLNVIIAFLAFVFAIGAGAVVYANAGDIAKKGDIAKLEVQVVKKSDLAKLEAQVVKKDDLAKVEEHVDKRFAHVDKRFDKLEADFAYIKEKVGGGDGGTGARKA